MVHEVSFKPYVRMYVCMYACMYVCMYVLLTAHIFTKSYLYMLFIYETIRYENVEKMSKQKQIIIVISNRVKRQCNEMYYHFAFYVFILNMFISCFCSQLTLLCLALL